MDHGVSLEHSQHRGASTVKQRLLSSSMFCSHQHTGPIAACRIHLNGVLPFSVLTKDWKGKALRALLLVFSLLFVWFFFFISILSSLFFDFVFLESSPPYSFGAPSFFVSANAASTFYDPWMQYERSPGNTLTSCTDRMCFIRTAAAFRMGNRCTRSMGCKRMHCKAFPSKFKFQIWNGHLSGFNSSALGACNSLLNDNFSNCRICADHSGTCGSRRSVSSGSSSDPPGPA